MTALTKVLTFVPRRSLIVLLVGGVVASSSGQTLLFGDNFNVPNTGTFDGAPLAGRLSGSLGDIVQLRSARIQHHIDGMQLRMLMPSLGGSGRIRFHEQADLIRRFDWASGSAGAEI